MGDALTLLDAVLLFGVIEAEAAACIHWHGSGCRFVGHYASCHYHRVVILCLQIADDALSVRCRPALISGRLVNPAEVNPDRIHLRLLRPPHCYLRLQGGCCGLTRMG